MSINIWTGFQWCVPANWQQDHTESKRLLQKSGRWGAVLLLNQSSKGVVSADFKDACDKVMDARQALGGGRSLDQCIARIAYFVTENLSLTITNVDAANRWLENKGYYDSLNYFVQNGGRMAIVFNELNVTDEKQYNIDPRTMGYLSYALRNRYWNRGNRQLYTLFPGPSGFLPKNTGDWAKGFYDYFAKYDFLSSTKTPRTFGQAYGSAVDPLLSNVTMLWHGGRGVFDRLSLHIYTSDPNQLRQPYDHDRNGLPYQYLNWTRDLVDPSGWVYVTEVSGASGTDISAQKDAGSALADFENNVNAIYRNQSPNFLQGVYGYVLQPTINSAVTTPAHKIGDAFIDGYNARRNQLGF